MSMRQRAGDAWRSIPERMDAAEASGEFRFPRRGAIVRPQKHAYEWRVNVTQLKNADGSATDGTDARSLSAGEVEGRRQAVDYLRFLRAKVPGFADAYALDIAPQLGIRETRRLVGEATLTADDVLGCADFSRHRRRQRLAARAARGRRRRMALAADPRVAWLQSAALSDAAAPTQ